MKPKVNYRYFHKFNGELEKKTTTDQIVANNSSYNAGMPYFEVSPDGTEKEIKPHMVITRNLIDDGFHNRILRKNPQPK